MADAAAVLNGALAGSGLLTTTRGRALCGCLLSRCLLSRRGGFTWLGISRRFTTSDGSRPTVAILGDGVVLELGMSLLGSGVHGEDHARAAVVASLAVEP